LHRIFFLAFKDNKRLGIVNYELILYWADLMKIGIKKMPHKSEAFP